MEKKLAAGVVITCCLAVLLRWPEQLSFCKYDVATKVFDFYKISLQWPKTYCETQPPGSCKMPIIKHFTIHGLWPQYNPDKQVPPYGKNSSCTDERPTPETDITNASLNSILKSMEHYWPNLLKLPNLKFWRHEWSQHGKCWKYPANYTKYFSAALDFIQQYDLLDILSKKGICPGNTIDRENFSNAIKEVIVNIPEIACCEERLLFEIRICFNRDELKQNCPTRFSSCSQAIELPRA